ncbi:hypothetical protein [Burkholderia stagnalis]|nr:hypothetical protein [Burkholderia stagnalis]WGS42670.1 hypothetical protein LFL97_03805 [Burkholderia sp. JSH-S8]
MMRSAMQHVQRNIASPAKAVDRARAAIRSLRPIAFAYLADRVYGG